MSAARDVLPATCAATAVTARGGSAAVGCNTYSFEDLELGHEETFCVNVDERLVDLFFDITQDTNLLHHDAAFAKRNAFKDKVVYGMLTASFLSTLAGVYLPGERSLIHEADVKFLRPVYAGDTLKITGCVADMHESVKQMEIRVTITNQHGDKVLKGKMKVGFLNGK